MCSFTDYSLGRNNAAGIDAIPAEAYIYGGPIVINVLCQFFNLLVTLRRPKGHQELPTNLSDCGGEKESGLKNYRLQTGRLYYSRVVQFCLSRWTLHFATGVLLGRIAKKEQEQHFLRLHGSPGGIRHGGQATSRDVSGYKVWMPLKLIRLLRAFFDNNHSYLIVGYPMSSSPIKNLRGRPQGSSLSPTLINSLY